MSTYSFRREQQGEVAGLKRLRAFTMPDMHTATKDMDQAREELLAQATLALQTSEDLDINYEPAIRMTREFYEDNEAWVQEVVEDAADRFDDAWDHALDAGVSIAMGTDAGTPFNFFADIPQEMAYMVDYGLSPERALEAATVNAADLLGLDDVGRVEEGYVADLVVLDADPTVDVTAWQDPVAVFARGDRVA